MTLKQAMRDKTLMARAQALATPDGYANERLGMGLHPTQAAVLRAIFPGAGKKSRVVFRCANEVGKTRRTLTAAVLYAAEILNAQVVTTAGVFRQIRDQLIPSLKSYSDRFDRNQWQFLDSAIKRFDLKKQYWTDVYTGFSANDEHGFQGFHRDENMPLFIAVDESQGVANGIFTAAEDRCNPDYFLACGSPGDPAGMFYRMETDLAAHYQHFKLTRPECTKSKGWWLDDADIQRMIDKHGIDNPFVRSTVFAEFSDVVQDALLSLGEYDKCLENPPERTGSDRHAFCDFAAGRHKNVLACRVGNNVWIEKKWADKNTMSAVGEFVTMFKRLERDFGFKAEEISGDADGLGKPMLQRIQEVGWQINEFHGGKSPRFDEGYRNAVGEAWGEGVAKIKRLQIILPGDDDLKGQMLARKCKRNSSGQFELESKEDMRKRGLSSPDEADAVLGAMMPAPRASSFSLVSRPEAIFEDWSGGDAHLQEESGERRFFS